MAETKDKRQWKVTHIMDKDDCPFLYSPGNLNGCDILDDRGDDDGVCTLETCPRRTEMSDEAREIVKGLFTQ